MSYAEMGFCSMAMLGREPDMPKSPACAATVRANKSAEPLVSMGEE
jgi:hypothetical protein